MPCYYLTCPRKSQIAIEYTYRLRESAPNTWAFWIHAINATRFEQGYREIASVAEIPGRDDPKTNIFQLVKQWLHDEMNGRWLMVLDNADDCNVFFDAPVEMRHWQTTFLRLPMARS